jgi:hypothetical protein
MRTYRSPTPSLHASKLGKSPAGYRLNAAAGFPDEALTELEAIRPVLAETFGPASAQARNLDK